MGLAATKLTHSPATGPHGRAEEAAKGLPEQLDNARLYAALSRAVSLAEGRGQPHALRVTYLSLRLADAVGIDESWMHSLYYGALLHDLGTPFIASRVANYCLSSEQSVLAVMPTIGLEEISAAVAEGTETRALNEIVEHCARGQAFAKELGFDDAVADTIYWHHEAWDGSGFPDGIRETEIPQTARIVAFSDWLDSVVGNHVAHTRGRVGDWLLRLVSEKSGNRLDPELAEVYESIADEVDPLLHLSPDGLVDEIIAMKAAWGHEPPNPRWRQALGRFVELVDCKSPYTQNHSRNVASYSQTMASEMGLPGWQIDLITLGALAHDIGKLSVPAKIIDKRGKLTEREWQTVRRHPKHSWDILNGIEGLSAVVTIGGQHHEWLNGSGYPKGHRGDEIALESRIVAAADVFEGMTADRPHREAIGIDRALELMGHERGHRFDPEVLSTLVDVVRKHEFGDKWRQIPDTEAWPDHRAA